MTKLYLFRLLLSPFERCSWLAGLVKLVRWREGELSLIQTEYFRPFLTSGQLLLRILQGYTVKKHMRVVWVSAPKMARNDKKMQQI